MNTSPTWTWTWTWARSLSDRRYFVGLHHESQGTYYLVCDDFGRLVLCAR